MHQWISVTGQSAAVDEKLSGHENLTIFGMLLGLSIFVASERARYSSRSLNSLTALTRPLKSPGGMRRRLIYCCEPHSPGAADFFGRAGPPSGTSHEESNVEHDQTTSHDGFYDSTDNAVSGRGGPAGGSIAVMDHGASLQKARHTN